MEELLWCVSFSMHLILVVWTLSLYTGVISQQKLQQNPEFLSFPEQTMASFNCTFSDGASDNFRWNRQQPGKGPELLTSIFSSGEKEGGRFTIHLNKDSRHVSLHIRVSQPSDSALYFCAVRTQCSPGTWSLHPNLLSLIKAWTRACLISKVFTLWKYLILNT